jgi:CubicO group peptidase (beta-lactamase class C family)
MNSVAGIPMYRQISSGRLIALVFAFLLAGCGGGGGGGGDGGIDEPFGNADANSGGGPAPGDADDAYIVVNPGLPETWGVAPENIGDGWSVSNPEAEGMNAGMLDATLQAIASGTYSGVDSMLVARNGRLVAEGYFNGYGRDTLHDLRSTGKSVVSALAGIAIGQSLLRLDDPISMHVPNFDSRLNMDANKRAIQVTHLLNMNSGLDCNDWSQSSPGHEERMYRRLYWVDYMLDRRMIHAAGTVPAYCTGGVVVLGSLIAYRSGMGLDGFANAYLFAPLGITQSHWRRDPQGNATGGTGMRLRPRDAAKFGQLYLNGGTWNGTRILSEAWVNESRRQVVTFEPNGDGYGFLWWKRNFYAGGGLPVTAVFASGNGGNLIFTFPSLDLLVVFTSTNYNIPARHLPFEILADRVLPAIR